MRKKPHQGTKPPLTHLPYNTALLLLLSSSSFPSSQGHHWKVQPPLTRQTYSSAVRLEKTLPLVGAAYAHLSPPTRETVQKVVLIMRQAYFPTDFQMRIGWTWLYIHPWFSLSKQKQTKASCIYYLHLSRENLLNWLENKSKEYLLLTLANRNSLN